MKTVKYLSMAMLLAAMCACTKEKLSLYHLSEKENQSEMILSFDSETDLANYANQFKESQNRELTKTTIKNSDFFSLWDSNREAVLSKLSPDEISEAEREGLEYEPEDEIIADPVFAKILNPKREVSVNGKIYRYVKNGVIVYDKTIDTEIIDNIDYSQYSSLHHRNEVPIRKGVSFIRHIRHQYAQKLQKQEHRFLTLGCIVTNLF